jgi:cytochrome c553
VLLQQGLKQQQYQQQLRLEWRKGLQVLVGVAATAAAYPRAAATPAAYMWRSTAAAVQQVQHLAAAAALTVLAMHMPVAAAAPATVLHAQQQRQKLQTGANKHVVGVCYWCYGMTVMIWLLMDLPMH